MPEYRVTWDIDVEADNPRAAAEKAQQMQQTNREGYWVGVFHVQEHDTAEGVTIDLDEPIEEGD